jgi:histidinol phosphatase-like enzyme
MLLKAARAHEIDLPTSWMIGDAEIDVEAGKRAGCKTARLVSSNQTANGKADVIASSLLDAANQILQRESEAGTLANSTINVYR